MHQNPKYDIEMQSCSVEVEGEISFSSTLTWSGSQDFIIKTWQSPKEQFQNHCTISTSTYNGLSLRAPTVFSESHKEAVIYTNFLEQIAFLFILAWTKYRNYWSLHKRLASVYPWQDTFLQVTNLCMKGLPIICLEFLCSKFQVMYQPHTPPHPTPQPHSGILEFFLRS